MADAKAAAAAAISAELVVATPKPRSPDGWREEDFVGTAFSFRPKNTPTPSPVASAHRSSFGGGSVPKCAPELDAAAPAAAVEAEPDTPHRIAAHASAREWLEGAGLGREQVERLVGHAAGAEDSENAPPGGGALQTTIPDAALSPAAQALHERIAALRERVSRSLAQGGA